MKRCLLAVGLMVSAVLAVAQDTSVQPGINRAYDGADYRRWQGMFETEGREVFEKREAIMAALDILPGMAIADVGAGSGAFSFPLARKVGITGKVIAQDISPEFLRGIEARARKENLLQLHSLLGGEKEARLAPSSVDMVFTCDTYHHFEYPQAMLASLHQALRPGGRLIVIDYERLPGRSSPWVLGHVRAGRETVVAEIEAAGFKLLRSHQFLRENFFIEFVRP